ncbi:MAG: antitoxin family protein [Deltaproteobacteria bacterium]|nr:antitoxin family protein [Deltaproteobacteria bacterium]
MFHEAFCKRIKRQRDIEAIYEDGVLKPLSPLNLKQHEKVRLTLVETKSAVQSTSGIFSGLDDNTIDEIALSPKFLPEES